MHFGFNLSRRPGSLARCAAWALLCGFAFSAVQPSAAHAQLTGKHGSQFTVQPNPALISNLLAEGAELEQSGNWCEALAHYEDALRDHPQDSLLRKRFDQARLHFSLERRLSDRSFRHAARTMTTAQALDLYGELLNKINTHYYDSPPWAELVDRGTRGLEVALADPTFRRQHQSRFDAQRVAQFSREMQTLTERAAIGSHREAVNTAAAVARLAAYHLQLRESATLLEFSAAAAGGLDNYSAFLTGDQLRDVYSQIEGNFVGLGVELKADDGALLIVDVISGSPAQRADIRAGDRIVAVDDQRTAELTTDEAAALLTGTEGSLVRVTITRSGHPSITKMIRREHVEVPSLEDVQIIDANFGVAYARIPTFQATTAADLEAALWKLNEQGMRSLVLDLRGNPGGLLTASVELADKFIAGGAIVSTRGRNQAETFDYRAHRAGTWRVPLVVLIDGDSASASEIFAAAIKDARRGTIVGERSFGKGSVQGIFPLGTSGAGIRLTTAKFYSPLGRPISKVGVHPDIDPRRATPAANGQIISTGAGQLVGYRGAATPERDDALVTAIEVAHDQPALAL